MVERKALLRGPELAAGFETIKNERFWKGNREQEAFRGAGSWGILTHYDTPTDLAIHVAVKDRLAWILSRHAIDTTASALAVILV